MLHYWRPDSWGCVVKCAEGNGHSQVVLYVCVIVSCLFFPLVHLKTCVLIFLMHF